MITEQEITIQQTLDWLEAEIEARGVTARVLRDQAEEHRTDLFEFMGAPIRIEDKMGAYDEAKLLVKLENAWNDREPRPAKLLHLIPAGTPQGVW